MTVTDIHWPDAQLVRLEDAIAPYVTGEVNLTGVKNRCDSHKRELFEVTLWWPDVAPRGGVWLRNVHIADIVLRPSPLGGWVASVVEVRERRPDTGRRPGQTVLADMRVEWGPDGGLRFGRMIIGPCAPELRLNGLPVKVPGTRWDCLKVLAGVPGQWIIAADIAERMPGRRNTGGVTEIIAALRKALGSGYGGWIQSHKAAGHRFFPAGWPLWPDLEDGAIAIDLRERRVQVGGREVSLGPRPLELLCELVEEPNGELSPEELLERLPWIPGHKALRAAQRQLNDELGLHHVIWDSDRHVYRTRSTSTDRDDMWR